MKRLRNHLIGVDQGTLTLSDFQVDGPFWTGEGAREFASEVTFDTAFRAPPAVSVHPVMWDISNLATARVELLAEDITATGFRIAFRTWGDTRIARLRAAWTAIGELPHDDDFDLY